jgi:hypothetical protein
MSDYLKDSMPTLLRRTEADEVRWKTTDDRNAVSVAVKDAVLVLVNDDMPKFKTIADRMRVGQVLGIVEPTGIALLLRNPEGKTVGSYRVMKTADPDMYATMQRLWDVAYDEAYKVTDTYAALQSALESDRAVGSSTWD